MKKGGKHNTITKQKMSKAHKGEKHHFYGKRLSLEHIQKLVDSHKGQEAWNRGQKTGITPSNKGIDNRKHHECKICSKKFRAYLDRVYCSIKCSNESKLGNQYNKNRIPSVETRLKMSEQRIGDKNWRWIADRTQLKQSEKKHLDSTYKCWMLNVKERDSWVCRIADVNCDGRLEAHHILNWVEYPELRYEINNGITLCHAHHPRGRAKEKELSPYFMELVTSSK